MKSQTPAVAMKYFEDRDVDVDQDHPVVTAVFRPKRGWRPVPGTRRVSHTHLVWLREQGVTSVQLKAGLHTPDFTLDELLGGMSPLEAEMTDGVPVSEGSGVVADRHHIACVMATIGIDVELFMRYLDDADRLGSTEFIVREIDAITRASVEGWRYRLVCREQRLVPGSGYELTCVAHDERPIAKTA